MKIRIADRVLVALAGVLLLALCACVIAQSFFAVPVLATVEGMLVGKKAITWLPYVICAVLLALSGYCIALLFRRRRGKRGFVLQDTDGGELSIALSAMDGLVCQCVAVHEEMQLLSSSIKTDRDGVVVDLRVALCNGVSIPLAVDALQKQIRQYVTSCSGVTVREVRVQVDAMDGQPVETPYAVPTMLQSAVPAPLLTRGEEEPAEKAIHQRIFSDPEEPAQVVTAAPEASAEEIAATEEPAAEEEPAECVENVEDSAEEASVTDANAEDDAVTEEPAAEESAECVENVKESTEEPEVTDEPETEEAAADADDETAQDEALQEPAEDETEQLTGEENDETAE